MTYFSLAGVLALLSLLWGIVWHSAGENAEELCGTVARQERAEARSNGVTAEQLADANEAPPPDVTAASEHLTTPRDITKLLSELPPQYFTIVRTDVSVLYHVARKKKGERDMHVYIGVLVFQLRVS